MPVGEFYGTFLLVDICDMPIVFMGVTQMN